MFCKLGEPSHGHVKFRPVDPCDLRCAMMRMRVCKMYYAGARVGNYCVFEGFGRPPMAMLHFGPVDPCDLRCLCTYVSKMYYARTRVGNYYVLQAWGPWPCYIFDLLIPTICDAR